MVVLSNVILTTSSRAFSDALYSKVGRLASEEVVLSLIRAKCIPILLNATEACPLLSRNGSCFEFTVTRLFMKLFRTTSPAVVKCCQLAFNFLPVHSQLDIRTANCLQKFFASGNSICYLFALTARRKLIELFVQFDNVIQLHVSFIMLYLNGLTCTNDALSLEASVNTIHNYSLYVYFYVCCLLAK